MIEHLILMQGQPHWRRIQKPRHKVLDHCPIFRTTLLAVTYYFCRLSDLKAPLTILKINNQIFVLISCAASGVFAFLD